MVVTLRNHSRGSATDCPTLSTVHHKYGAQAPPQIVWLNAFSSLTRLLISRGRQADRQSSREEGERIALMSTIWSAVACNPPGPRCKSLCPTAEQRCAALRLLTPANMQRCAALHPPFPSPWCVIATTYCGTVHAQHAHWQAVGHPPQHTLLHVGRCLPWPDIHLARPLGP